jgi:hypothetical protein
MVVITHGRRVGLSGLELKLAASKTAEIDSKATERAAWSAQALVELFCCFFIELFRFDHFQFSKQTLLSSYLTGNRIIVNLSLQ